MPEHAGYIDDLCREVEFLMKEKIADSIQKRVKADVSDPLYDEVVQHLLFCQTKCDTFYGRKEILSRCSTYIEVNVFFQLVREGYICIQNFDCYIECTRKVRHFQETSQVTCCTVSVTKSV